MKDHYVDSVKNLIDYIEVHLKEDISLDVLSRESCVSKYHLHRIFKALTGKSLIAYVRGRRLTRSLVDLTHSDLSVLDIAYEYNFEHEQSYIRAFKSVFLLTPNQYRISQKELAIQQKLDSASFHQVGNGLLIQPEMVRCGRFYLQGIMNEIIHDINLEHKTTNSLALDFYQNYFPGIENKVSPDVYYGLVLYTKDRLYSNFYVPSVETLTLNTSTPPMKSFTVPEGEYAVFKYVGFHKPELITYEVLYNLYDYIFGEWVVKSEVVTLKDFHFEKIDLKICSNTYCEMLIYIPISR